MRVYRLVDSNQEKYIKNANNEKLPVGVYHYLSDEDKSLVEMAMIDYDFLRHRQGIFEVWKKKSKVNGDFQSFCYKSLTKEEAENYLFGFKSIDQLKKWFYRSELMSLFKVGAKLIICEVNVEDVAFGDTQLIFDVNKHKITQEILSYEELASL